MQARPTTTDTGWRSRQTLDQDRLHIGRSDTRKGSMQEQQTDSILREAEVRLLTGLSRTTRWRMARQGTFPAPLRLSPGAVGWRASQITQWIQDRSKA